MSIMKIPSALYLGLLGSNTQGVALGNITPAGKDAVAKKRMATVDEWVNTHKYGYTKIGTFEISNTPLVGFKFTCNLRTAIHGGSDKWQVEDPRGFVAEISSTNLAELLSAGTVEKGEILDPCVWARLGSANVLLNTTSTAYTQAKKNTSISNAKARWQDVKLGNRIILQNSVEGVYLGKMGIMERAYWGQTDGQDNEQNLLQFNHCNLHVILNDTDNIMHFLAAPKLSRILNDTQMSEAECEDIANTAMQKTVTLKSHIYFSRPVCLYAMKKLTDNFPKIELELVDTDAQPAVRSYQKVVLCDYDGGFGEYVVFSNRQLIYEISREQLNQGKYVPNVVQIQSLGRPRYTQKQTDAASVQLQNYYELYCKVTTLCGNIIRVRV